MFITSIYLYISFRFDIFQVITTIYQIKNRLLIMSDTNKTIINLDKEMKK